MMKKEYVFTQLENCNVADKRPFSGIGDEILCKTKGNLKDLKKQNSLKGFTLIEVLVAITVFAIISFAISAVFTQGIKVWKVSQSKLELIMTASFSLDSVAESFNAFLSSGNYVIEGTADSVYIIDIGKGIESRNVVYRLFLENGGDGKILKVDKIDEDGALSTMQISPVENFSINYFSEIKGELIESADVEHNAKVKAIEIGVDLLNDRYGLKNTLSVSKLIKMENYEEQ